MQAVIASNISMKINGGVFVGRTFFSGATNGVAVFTVPANSYAIVQVMQEQADPSNYLYMEIAPFPLVNNTAYYMSAGTSIRVAANGAGIGSFIVNGITFINSP